MVVDPRAQLQAEVEQRIAPLRARLATCTDRTERRRLKAEIRAIRRDARRHLRSAVW